MSDEVGPALWSLCGALHRKYSGDREGLRRELELRTREPCAPLCEGGLDALRRTAWFVAMKQRFAAAAAAGCVVGRWWERDAGGKPFALEKLGYLRDPPSLLLQYRGPGGQRRRRIIHLEEDLEPRGPVQDVTRRLLQSHGTLLAPAEMERVVRKLQLLMRAGKAATVVGGSGVLAGNGARSEESVGASSVAAAAAATTERVRKADLGLLYRDRDTALRDVDLQDADDVTVKEFKAAMNQAFEAHLLKPGDPGYAYDARVNVKPTKKSEWDSDDD